MRDRVAIKVIVWCIRHLPTKPTSVFIEAAVTAGAQVVAAQHIEWFAEVLKNEVERQQRPNT